MATVSKGLIEERKKLWPDIKFRLEFADIHKKAELKIFESYFLKGAEPNLYPMENDPIPLVYRLWLAPDQSIESWQAITARLLAGPEAWTSKVSVEPTGDGESWRELCKGYSWGWQIERSLRDSHEILIQQAAADHYNGVVPFVGSDVAPPLGFMGGSEKKLLEFMMGATPGSEQFLYEGKALFEPPTYFGHRFYRAMCIWLDGRLPANPYSIMNYLEEHWYKSMTAAYLEKVANDKDIQFYLGCFLALIARYPEKSQYIEQQRYCRVLRKLLEKGSLLEPLNTMWAAAKAYKGVIDINSIMRKEPLLIGDF